MSRVPVGAFLRTGNASPTVSAMCFLKSSYAAIGGLKATFTTSYFHTVIVYVVCCIFFFKVFIPGDKLGGHRRRECCGPLLQHALQQ